MNTEAPLEIKLPSVTKSFEDHLKLSYNKRILFSAKFGAGKSTFLNNYFKEKGNDYIVLKLYPVNYSVASNEDVFELIKYDLFSELLAKYADKLQMNNEDYSTLLVGQSYLQHDLKIYPFIKALLKAAVPNGKEIIEVVDAAKDIYTNFKNYQDEIKKGEREVIDDYVQWCEKRKGSIYERDEITSLLADLISRVKSQLNGKEVVLIVDDLDRLDPEHLFRLFNVFSAHYDAVTDLNKFGLDKVIFVCDYNNVVLMYKNRYGVGVDFEGYINKFYSTDVFYFNPNKYLLESIEDVLLKKPTDEDVKRYKYYSPFDRNNYLVKGLVLLFGDLIKYDYLTMRGLDRFKHYFIPDYEIEISQQRFHVARLFFITFIKLITQSISLEILEQAFIDLGNDYQSETLNDTEPTYRWLINQTIYLFLSGNQISGYSDDVGEFIVDNEAYTFKLTYHPQEGLTTLQLTMPAETKYNIYKFMNAAVREGKNKNLF